MNQFYRDLLFIFFLILLGVFTASSVYLIGLQNNKPPQIDGYKCERIDMEEL